MRWRQPRLIGQHSQDYRDLSQNKTVTVTEAGEGSSAVEQGLLFQRVELGSQHLYLHTHITAVPGESDPSLSWAPAFKHAHVHIPTLGGVMFYKGQNTSTIFILVTVKRHMLFHVGLNSIKVTL